MAFNPFKDNYINSLFQYVVLADKKKIPFLARWPEAVYIQCIAENSIDPVKPWKPGCVGVSKQSLNAKYWFKLYTVNAQQCHSTVSTFTQNDHENITRKMSPNSGYYIEFMALF